MAPAPRPPRASITLAARSIAPFVLTCEHATHRLPQAITTSGDERAVLRTHWGWDIGGWELTRALARRLGATAVSGRCSRLWIDLNRRADDPSLVRRSAGGIDLSWNHKLNPVEVERRLVDYHMPYHLEVERAIQHRLVHGVRPLLLAVHTFTPLFDGRPRRFEIGLLFEEHATAARRLGRRLRAAGLSVRYNQPYSGLAGMMYSADRHGKHHGLPCLELEVNQALFDRADNVARLAREVERGLRELVAPTAQRSARSRR